jgi:hypothetical protein
VSEPSISASVPARSRSATAAPPSGADTIEIDPTTIAEIQQLLDIAHDSNAVSPLDPHYAMAQQDVIKAPVAATPGRI